MNLSDVDVIVLAAGFGKRLGERTANTPKPLIQIAGKNLLERIFEQLRGAGFRRVCLNLHYLGDQIRDFVGDGSRWGLEVTFSFEPVILDTGGAIKNIEPWLRSSQFFIINSDIVIDSAFPFSVVLDAHCSRTPEPLVTLVLRNDANASHYGELAIDSTGKVCEFLGRSYLSAIRLKRGLMFTGIQCLSRRILALMPPKGSVFSITKDTYTQILGSGLGELNSYIYEGYWNDAGTVEGLSDAEHFLLKKAQAKAGS